MFNHVKSFYQIHWIRLKWNIWNFLMDEHAPEWLCNWFDSTYEELHTLDKYDDLY